jgi:hypothetical protein
MSKNNHWTKRELSLYKSGYKDLARAVIRQWVRDKAPESERGMIMLWESLIEEDFNNTGVEYVMHSRTK